MEAKGKHKCGKQTVERGGGNTKKEGREGGEKPFARTQPHPLLFSLFLHPTSLSGECGGEEEEEKK